MKKVDYIIVGDGFAALFFAHRLLVHRKSFLLFSAGEKGASHISAGVINPVVLKKFTTFWLASEQIDCLNQTLSEIEKYTGKNYLVPGNVHRIFHDDNEKMLWLAKTGTEQLSPFLDSRIETLDTVTNPHGAAAVKKSARVNVKDLFEDFHSYLSKNQHLIKENFEHKHVFANTYKDIQFKHLVFCEGVAVSKNPFFRAIPVLPNKGHHLVVKLSVPLPSGMTLKKKHFLFPIEKGLHYYGGTYDADNCETGTDEHKKRELIDGLREIYPYDFEVIEVNYGFRPTVKDRRPILGNHPTFENMYIFNGLGARGILNGCYFSRELYSYIENGKSLIPEVDVRRFSLKWD